jgi:cytochrome c-type biogenesis protein CcmH
MSAFLLAAVLLTAVALMFLLPALLRGDGAGASAGESACAQDQLNLAVLRDQARELDADLAAGVIEPAAWREARGDLERRVAEDVQTASAGGSHSTSPAARPQRALAMGIALVLPVLAAALYFHVGSPVGAALETSAQGEPHPMSNAQIGAMVDALAQRLRKEPGDADGWDTLASSYVALKRYREAANAYARLAALVPDNASVLADYADALASAQGNSLLGEPERLLARALAIDPRHVKALALAASAAFQRGDFSLAETRWKQVLELVPPESEFAQATRASIEQAHARGAGKEAPQQKQQQRGAHLAGTVELDPALRARVAGSDVVFIFARAVAGPRAPLAVLRKRVSDLPLRFVLDDSMSMAPDARLSSFAQVVVGARISRSGSATAAQGDLEGYSAPTSPRADGVRVRIGSIRK